MKLSLWPSIIDLIKFMRCKLFIFRIDQTLKYRCSLGISILIKTENIGIYVCTYVREMRMLPLFVIKSKSVLLTNYSVARFFYFACNYYWITLRCCVHRHSHTHISKLSLCCALISFHFITIILIRLILRIDAIY